MHLPALKIANPFLERIVCLVQMVLERKKQNKRPKQITAIIDPLTNTILKNHPPSLFFRDRDFTRFSLSRRADGTAK